MDSLEGIAYDNAVRALDKQERVLEEIRARTALLVAASSLAASLLGREAFRVARPGWLVILAMAAFVVSLAASLFVVLPRKRFVFSLEGPRLYERLYELRHRPTEVRRQLAYQLHEFWTSNDSRLQPVFHAFRVAVVALGVEVIALALLVSGKLV